MAPSNHTQSLQGHENLGAQKDIVGTFKVGNMWIRNKHTFRINRLIYLYYNCKEEKGPSGQM